MFLYSKLLNRPLENVQAARSKKQPRIPVVLSVGEVRLVLVKLSGANALMVKLLYGGGLHKSIESCYQEAGGAEQFPELWDALKRCRVAFAERYGERFLGVIANQA